MNKIKSILNRTFTSKFFWVSGSISFFLTMLIQVVIHLGCKYDFIPKFIAINLIHRNSESADGIEPSMFSWQIPIHYEVILYVLIFFIVSNLFLLEEEVIDKNIGAKKIKFRFSILLVLYFAFLANHTIGRSLFSKVMPEEIKKEMVIDCSMKTIRFGSIVLNHDAKNVCDLCPAPKRGCIYSEDRGW